MHLVKNKNYLLVTLACLSLQNQEGIPILDYAYECWYAG